MIDRLAEMLREAKRPLLYAGRGVILADASRELGLVAELAGIPVATTAGGKGAFSEQSELAVGVGGRYSRKVANDLLAQADLVVALGSRLGALATDGYRLPPAETRIVQVDVDPQALGSSRPVTLAIAAEAKVVLGELASRFANGPSARAASWRDEVRQQVTRWRNRLDEASAGSESGGEIRVESVLRILRAQASETDYLVSDTGYMAAWTAALYPVNTPGRWYQRCAGSLGWAFAAALGVQLAAPEARVFCVIGDGGVGYHIGDLETALRLGLPTVTVVLNNGCLAYEDHIQRYLYDESLVPEVNEFQNVDYGAVAQAFGAYGARVESAAEFEDAMREAILDGRPALIDVRIGRDQVAPVTSYDAVFARVL
jgi:acetolactate synthase-1/2/3 large subunit